VKDMTDVRCKIRLRIFSGGRLIAAYGRKHPSVPVIDYFQRIQLTLHSIDGKQHIRPIEPYIYTPWWRQRVMAYSTQKCPVN